MTCDASHHGTQRIFVVGVNRHTRLRRILSINRTVPSQLLLSEDPTELRSAAQCDRRLRQLARATSPRDEAADASNRQHGVTATSAATATTAGSRSAGGSADAGGTTGVGGVRVDSGSRVEGNACSLRGAVAAASGAGHRRDTAGGMKLIGRAYGIIGNLRACTYFQPSNLHLNIVITVIPKPQLSCIIPGASN